MIQDIYNNNYIIYAFAGLCGLGILIRFILNMVYIYLVKQSDKVGSTKNKHLKHLKMKFETCYKLNIGVNNVDTFVDKNMTKYRFCGILLSTWENISGQVLYLSFLVVPICAVFGVIYDVDSEQILYTGAVGILVGAVLIFVDKMINLSVKKQMIRLNLLDYLENFCKVRLEHEVNQPEKLEKFRKEYLLAVGISNSNLSSENENNKEINRRKEARKRKEEEKRLRALKREEEQKRIEEARREEERRKQEERKRLAAQRREEELRKLQEEREAMMRRREELRKKAEEKQRLNELKLKEKEEKEKLLSSMEEELRAANKVEEKQILESIEEAAAEKEEVNNETAQKPHKQILLNMSPEEEKLIEDVLKEFFA